MASVNLTWDDDNLIEEGYRVYRSLSPIDPDNPPAPLAELPADSENFGDASAQALTDYHYRVSAVLASLEMFSAEVTVSTPAAQRITLRTDHFDELDAEVRDSLQLSGDAQSGDDLLSF